ncbi:O-antigen ligase family protein [Halocella sp. SP3-1]|nr:O-antigen ligase family protein [Halocella sp. SP3-1]
MFMMFSSAISIAGSSIGLGLAFICWILKMMINKEFGFVSNPLNKPIGIFLLTMIISFWGSYNLIESLKEIESFLIVFILYYLIINNVSSMKEVKNLFNMGLLSITISSLYGLFYQHYYLGMSRLDSTFMALDFGALLLTYLLFSVIYFLFDNALIKDRIKYGLLIPILTLTLIYNKSRGAWLGFVGAAVISLWIYRRKWVPILLIVVLLVVVLAPNNIQERIKSIVDLQNNKSNLGRLALWKGAFLIFRDYPFNGIGLGNFREVYMTHYKQPNTTANSHAHNNFLHFLAETGIIGLAGLIYLLYSILKYLYLNYLQIENISARLFVLSTFSSVIGTFIIQGFTETNFSKAVVGRTIWFIIALAFIIIQLSNNNPINRTGNNL